jgi:hypothetical protein
MIDTRAGAGGTLTSTSPAASRSATPAEMTNLLTPDALIATYGMDGDELHDLMLLVRSLYRGGGQLTRRQGLFLH